MTWGVKETEFGGGPAKIRSTSHLFRSYRAVGVVCDEDCAGGFAVTAMGSKKFVTVSLGRNVAVYDGASLKRSMVSEMLPTSAEGKIASVAPTLRDVTFCAAGSSLVAYKRLAVRACHADAHDAEIVSLLAFGSTLVSVDVGGCVKVWATALTNVDPEDEPAASLQHAGAASFELPADFGTPTSLIHPSTYLNKVLVASQSGKLALCNVKTGKVIHEFPGWGSPVRCVAQSPAVDVIAVGLDSGVVVVHNIRFDKTIAKFKHHDSSGVAAISFRTDAYSPSTLASASDKGAVYVWDLDERELHATIRDAHGGAIVGMQYYANEPILLTTGADNALKMWIFDKSGGDARLLKERSGHRLPPTRIRYYGGELKDELEIGGNGRCNQLLSASRDRSFRVINTHVEHQSVEMSQGHILKKSRALNVPAEQLKLPPIIAFASHEARERDWCNIITAHEGESACYVWSFDKRKMGKGILRADGGFRSKLTDANINAGRMAGKEERFAKPVSVAVSACGNFGIVGTDSGVVYRYNMQSGIQRGTYPKGLGNVDEKAAEIAAKKPAPGSIRTIAAMYKKKKSAVPTEELATPHDGPVRAVLVDDLNRYVVSAGADAKVKFWDLSTHELVDAISLGAPASKMVMSKGSGMFAVACDDFQIRVFSYETRKMVRRFAGHTNEITDLCFCHKSEQLASSSLDGTIRVHDLATARTVDIMYFKSAPTSVSWSHTGEYLATTHVESRAVCLWMNRGYFEGGPSSTRTVRKAVHMLLPDVAVDGEDLAYGEDEDEISDEENEDEIDYSNLPETIGHAGTLQNSGGNPEKWHSLIHIDAVKARGKLKEEEEEVKSAPFFLGMTSEAERFGVSGGGEAAPAAAVAARNDDSESSVSASRIIRTTGLGGNFETEFTRLLSAAFQEDESIDVDDDDSDSDDEMEADATKLTSIIEKRKRALPRAQAYAKVSELVSTQTISATDYEIRSLAVDEHDDEGAARIFMTLRWILATLDAGLHWDMINAVLDRVLDAWHDVLRARPELKALLQKVHDVHTTQQRQLEGDYNTVLCMMDHMAGLQMI